jgi:serine/threonine protein kinase
MRLGRDVAIKILPRPVAADRDRIARFEREARVLAALNHPHIATIHGIEESNGILALVMELVEGETLAEWIAHHPVTKGHPGEAGDVVKGCGPRRGSCVRCAGSLPPVLGASERAGACGHG